MHLQGFWPRTVYLKCFGNQLKTVYLQGPCSSRPCISRPCCTYFISLFSCTNRIEFMDEVIISRIQGRFRLPLLNEGNRRLKIKQELLKIRHTLSDDDLTSLAKLFVGRSGWDLEKFSKGNIHNQSPILLPTLGCVTFF